MLCFPFGNLEFGCLDVCCYLLQIWWSFGSMFGAGLALAVMPTLGWHWYLGLAATPLALVLLFFLVFCCYVCVCVCVCM